MLIQISTIVREEVVDGEPTGRRNYYDIPLTEGAKFEQDVDPAQLAPENDIAIESESGSIQTDEYFSADDMSAFITVDAEESAEGVVIGAGDYAKGDLVELTALTSDEEYALSGWYIDDELVSTDRIYRFTTLEDVTVRAEFERKYDFDDSFKMNMSDGYGEYHAQVYKNGDEGRGILIMPFTEDAAETMTVYFTSYEQGGAILSDGVAYEATLGKNGYYDFGEFDFDGVNSFVLKDAAGGKIASASYNAVERIIPTVGQYSGAATMSATADGGEIRVELCIYDDEIERGGIKGYIAKYASDGELMSCKAMEAVETEDGFVFTGSIDEGCKVMIWDGKLRPIGEAFIPQAL